MQQGLRLEALGFGRLAQRRSARAPEPTGAGAG
jgi:hypothetical protein